jgi:hypothetical protein
MATHFLFAHTDSGNRDLGRAKRLDRSIPEEDIVAMGKTLATKYGVNYFLIVRTSPYRGKSGAWYIKGFDGRVSYDDIVSKIERNVENNMYSRRECIMVRF